MLRSFCDVCDQPLLHPGYNFERQFTSLMGPGVGPDEGLVVRVLIDGSRPDETHCCDDCFLMLTRDRGAAQTRCSRLAAASRQK